MKFGKEKVVWEAAELDGAAGRTAVGRTAALANGAASKTEGLASWEADRLRAADRSGDGVSRHRDRERDRRALDLPA